MTLSTGATLGGRYTLGSAIASGGMGTSGKPATRCSSVPSPSR